MMWLLCLIVMVNMSYEEFFNLWRFVVWMVLILFLVVDICKFLMKIFGFLRNDFGLIS